MISQMPAVRLRSWRPGDAPDVASMTQDEHVRRWSSMGHDVEAWIERQRSELRGPSRAVCLPEDDRALGKVALRMPGHASPATTCEAVLSSDAPVGELSYWLVPDARGCGLARAAVQTMMESIVATTELRSVVLDVEVTNVARCAWRTISALSAASPSESSSIGWATRASWSSSSLPFTAEVWGSAVWNPHSVTFLAENVTQRVSGLGCRDRWSRGHLRGRR